MTEAWSCYEEGCKLERELTAVTEQRDRLVEALELFIEEQCENRPHEHSNALGDARKALQSLTPKLNSLK